MSSTNGPTTTTPKPNSGKTQPSFGIADILPIFNFFLILFILIIIILIVIWFKRRGMRNELHVHHRRPPDDDPDNRTASTFFVNFPPHFLSPNPSAMCTQSIDRIGENGQLGETLQVGQSGHLGINGHLGQSGQTSHTGAMAVKETTSNSSVVNIPKDKQSNASIPSIQLSVTDVNNMSQPSREIRLDTSAA